MRGNGGHDAVRVRVPVRRRGGSAVVGGGGFASNWGVRDLKGIAKDGCIGTAAGGY